MREALPFLLLVVLLLLLIVVAVALCVAADRVQLSLSYRAAQRRFRRYRDSQSHDFPSATQALLSDPVLRSARDLEVTYPSTLERDDPAYYHVAHFVPPEGGLLYSTRKLRKLGLVPFARANSIVLYCASQDASDSRLWSYDTKSRQAYPMDVDCSRLITDLRATLPSNQSLEPTAGRRDAQI